MSIARSSGRTPSSAAGPAVPAPSAHPAPSARTDLRLDHLPTTTLAELNAAAGLLTRVDRKYLVPLTAVQDVADQLAGRARVLQIDGAQQFSYASTYFDTPALDTYLLAARKRRRRFKVRTRTYLDSGLCFLEVKTRGSRGATVKERTAYELDNADRLTDAGRAFIASCLAEAGVTDAAGALDLATALQPVMGTTYHRTTLHLPDDDARATIDTDLRWFALGGARDRARIAVGPLAVVETKNPSTPSPTDRLLWAHGHRPTTISKYATGMALLHPELPANKWHRVMRRDLAPGLAA